MAAPVAAFEVPAEAGAHARLRPDPFGAAALQSSPTLSLPEAIYPYRDESGNFLFEVVRFPGKSFAFRQYDARGKYRWDMQGVRRVPYRLPQLIEAVARGQRIYVVEGERDADAIAAAGGAATTSPGGANKWRDEFSEYLRRANVVVVADRDESGRRHALDVGASLISRAASVQIVQARAGKDAADHLGGGFGLDDFEPLDVSREDLVRERLSQLARRRERQRRATSQPAAAITAAPLVSRRDSIKWASDRWAGLGLASGQTASEYDAKLAEVIGRDLRTSRRIRGQLVQAGLVQVEKQGRRRIVTLTPHGATWKRMPFPRFLACATVYLPAARADGDGEIDPLPFEAPTNPLVRSATGGFDAVDFLRKLGVTKVTTVGEEVEFSCPHHRDVRPSASIRKDGSAYGCFSCGRSGGADDLLAELHGVTPATARRWIHEAYAETAPDVQRIEALRRPIVDT